MSLINNWDLKNQNTSIYVMKSDGGAQEGSLQTYLISDLGASFGAVGFAWPKSKSRDNFDQYSHSKFITKVAPDYVDFNAPARRALLYSFGLLGFFMRASVALDRQSRLAPTQSGWGNCWPSFRRISSRRLPRFGYSSQEVDGFASDRSPDR